MKGLEYLSYKEQLRGLGLWNLDNRWDQGGTSSVSVSACREGSEEWPDSAWWCWAIWQETLGRDRCMESSTWTWGRTTAGVTAHWNRCTERLWSLPVKSPLDAILVSVLWNGPVEQGSWTTWAPGIHSNLTQSVILWNVLEENFQCESRSILTIMLLEWKVKVTVFSGIVGSVHFPVVAKYLRACCGLERESAQHI